MASPGVTSPTLPKALTIAGSDSGGGAGIEADLKAFFALGVYGAAAITALTAQNTLGVQGVYPVTPEFVAQQMDSVLVDIGADAAKTGMLANAAIVEAVADRVRAHRLTRLVVDPVMVAKSGDPLLAPDAVEAVQRLLLPLALVVTPNLPEAERLTGLAMEGRDAMKEAARRLHGMGVRYVVVKGGHVRSDPHRAADLVYDGTEFVELEAPRIATPHTHGTGCTFSAAIAAYLARGLEPLDAIRKAKAFITAAIQAALPVGSGRGPTNPWAGADPNGPGWVVGRRIPPLHDAGGSPSSFPLLPGLGRS